MYEDDMGYEAYDPYSNDLEDFALKEIDEDRDAGEYDFDPNFLEADEIVDTSEFLFGEVFGPYAIPA